MELIPYDDLKPGAHQFHLAPMVDFLFLMLTFFATMAVSRAVLSDIEIQLAELRLEQKQDENPERVNRRMQQMHWSISSSGEYKWVTEFGEYPMPNRMALQEELSRQYELGLLPVEKSLTEILLHIDRKAPWQAIAEALFTGRELGFAVYPVYEPLVETNNSYTERE